MTDKEPMFDVAQLAHFEIYGFKIRGISKVFKDILGMDEVGRRGKSVYACLRGSLSQHINYY